MSKTDPALKKAIIFRFRIENLEEIPMIFHTFFKGANLTATEPTTIISSTTGNPNLSFRVFSGIST